MVDESLLLEYPEVRKLRYLFLDLNSYFASVEQQENPELRNRPMAVVPVDADTSFIIACSYEAKAFGIKTGTRISDAKAMCPNLLCIRATPGLYTLYHRKILDAVETVLPVEKVCSIDEMQFRLLGKECEPVRAKEIALEMKLALRNLIGEHVRASIGIAANPFLAKVATDMMKPDGLVILQHEDLPHALHRLSLTDLCGINKRMEARLQSAGIFSVEELCRSSKSELRKAWGSIVGERWWYKLRGVDLTESESDRKSLSHSHVMAPNLRTDEGSRQVLLRLLQKASARLRSHNLLAGTMCVSVSGAKKWKKFMRFDATNDLTTLTEYFARAWSERNFSGPVKVGIDFGELEDVTDATPSLFSAQIERADLSKAIDELNGKFGKNAVFLAGMERAKNAAPERIAFQKTELFSEGKGDNEWPDTFRGPGRG